MAIYTVIGKRWFERVNGNTYHSATVYKDGKLIGRVPFQYGYERHYEQTALEIIKQDDPTITVSTLWRIKDLGHELVNEVSDVPRKKDL